MAELTMEDFIGEAQKLPAVGLGGALPSEPTQLPELGATPGLVPPTAAPSALPTTVGPSALPTLEQFQDPYLKTFQATQDIQQQGLKDTAEQLSRKLYGQNIGAESGLGQENVAKLIEQQTSQLAPYAERLAGEAGVKYQDVQQQGAERILGMVQSGQITGEQAEQSLRDAGIDPNTFRTPEQLAQVRESEELEVFKGNIQDEAVRAEIDTMEEYQFFMDKGRTYDEEVLDIIETSKDLNDYVTRLPDLKDALTREIAELDKVSGMTPDWFGENNKENLERRAAGIQLKVDRLKGMINDINAGIVPVTG